MSKLVFSTLLFVLGVSGVNAQTPNAADQPSVSGAALSYDDTLRYIQERLANQLEERSHCKFTYRSKYNVMFDASDLTRKVIWSKDTKSANVSCHRGKLCVGNYNSWRFEPHDGVDQKKMQDAVLHLLELCNAVPATPESF